MLDILQKDTVRVRKNIEFGTARKPIGYYCKVWVARLGQQTSFGSLIVFRIMEKNKYHFGSGFTH